MAGTPAGTPGFSIGLVRLLGNRIENRARLVRQRFRDGSLILTCPVKPVFRFSLFRFSVLYMLFFGLVMGLKSLEIARKYIYISENQNWVKSPKNRLKMQARFPGCWWAGFSILFPGFFGLFRACLVGLVGWCIIRNRKARKTGLQAGFSGKEKPGCFARFTSGLFRNFQ